MAIRAAGLAGEQPEAGKLVCRQRGLLARDPAVEARRRRYEGTLVGRERLGEILRIDPRRFRKGQREGPLHGGIGREAGNDGRKRLGHLVGRLDRTGDLLLQAARPAVPEHRRRPRQIPQGRRVALERAAGHAAALDPAVGETLGALVTARAGQAAVDGKTLVVEQRLAERALLLGEQDCRPETARPRAGGMPP